MQRFNYNINEDIQTKKHFKNPSIYEKLIGHYDLDEYGSNFSNVCNTVLHHLLSSLKMKCFRNLSMLKI